MNKFMLTAYLIMLISSIFLIYALIFNQPNWIVYGIAIIFIPLFILSLGLVTMAKAKKEEEEERKEEPFIGY
jgi:energy-converting hydrogenase A subunit I